MRVAQYPEYFWLEVIDAREHRNIAILGNFFWYIQFHIVEKLFASRPRDEEGHEYLQG